MGLETLIMGASTAATAVLQMIFDLEAIFYLLAAGVAVGLAVMVYAQFKNLYSQPQTPSGRVFPRHTALNFLAIHKVFPRKFALSGGKIPRPAGMFGCEYRF